MQDFRLSAKKKGSIARAVQIDHIYMFVRETLENFLHAAGFDILFMDTNEAKRASAVAALRKRGLTDHMRVVAEKAGRVPFGDPAAIQELGPDVAASLARWRLVAAHLPFRLRRWQKRLPGFRE